MFLPSAGVTLVERFAASRLFLPCDMDLYERLHQVEQQREQLSVQPDQFLFECQSKAKTIGQSQAVHIVKTEGISTDPLKPQQSG